MRVVEATKGDEVTDENRAAENGAPADVLKATFWSALDDCETPPYIGTAPNGDEGWIDGLLPDELWKRMADELQART